MFRRYRGETNLRGTQDSRRYGRSRENRVSRGDDAPSRGLLDARGMLACCPRNLHIYSNIIIRATREMECQKSRALFQYSTQRIDALRWLACFPASYRRGN